MTQLPFELIQVVLEGFMTDQPCEVVREHLLQEGLEEGEKLCFSRCWVSE